MTYKDNFIKYLKNEIRISDTPEELRQRIATTDSYLKLNGISSISFTEIDSPVKIQKIAEHLRSKCYIPYEPKHKALLILSYYIKFLQSGKIHTIFKQAEPQKTGWDENEALMILYAYQEIKKGSISKDEACRILHKFLNEYESKNNIFPKTMEAISNSIDRYEYLFTDGKKGKYNQVKAFSDAFHKLNYEKLEYHKLLEKAKSATGLHSFSNHNSVKIAAKTNSPNIKKNKETENTWDKYEAAILLDFFINQGSPEKYIDSIQDISDLLKKYRKNASEQKSIIEISLSLSKIRNEVTCGRGGVQNNIPVFKETYSLYKNDRISFYTLLQDAREKTGLIPESDDTDMAGKPWDIYEAAILFYFYLKIKNEEISNIEACITISGLTRAYGAKNGVKLDDKYRNITGISMRMRQVATLFTKKTNSFDKPNKLDRVCYDLYINENEEFAKLIDEAKARLNLQDEKPEEAVSTETKEEKPQRLSSYNKELKPAEKKQEEPKIKTATIIKTASKPESGSSAITNQKSLTIKQNDESIKESESKDASEKAYYFAPDEIKVDFNDNKNYIYTKPLGFTFFGEIHKADSWKELYTKALHILQAENYHIFDILVDEPFFNKNASTSYLRSNPEILISPYKIKDGMYVETNYNAKTLISHLQAFLHKCGVLNFEIYYQEQKVRQTAIQKTEAQAAERQTAFAPEIPTVAVKPIHEAIQKKSEPAIIGIKPEAEEDNPVKTETDFEVLTEPDEGWIKFDFSNFESFEGTIPAYCMINNRILEGSGWRNILIGIIERELGKNSPKLRNLYEASNQILKSDRPYLLREKISASSHIQLSNGYYIYVNYSIANILKQIAILCDYFGYDRDSVILYGKLKNPEAKITHSKTYSESVKASGISQQPVSNEQPSYSQKIIDTAKAEEYIKDAGIEGVYLKDITNKMPHGIYEYQVKQALESCSDIVEMSDSRYIHAENFADLDEAEEIIGTILKNHFRQFEGYSNKQLLYEASAAKLSMFLNDNDCDSDKLFCIARYLFQKKSSSNSPYVFYNQSIFETEPDYPKTTQGILIHQARLNDGMLNLEEAEAFLNKIKISGRIKQTSKIADEKTFLIYDDERYILSESIGINEEWLKNLNVIIDRLFKDANVSLVIPRDIDDRWFERLPTLPNNLKWTRILLQEIIDKYPEIKFRTITSGLKQEIGILAAAFTLEHADIHSFADAVHLYLKTNGLAPKAYEKNELHKLLCEAGMIEGGELSTSLHKALNDYRFSWSSNFKNVEVRG